MQMLRSLFRSRDMHTVALIDIGTESVAGAYALFSDAELPFMIYTTQVPVRGSTSGESAFALEHALQTLVERLMREGGPLLWKAFGSAQIESVLVSIDAPWQDTALRVEELHEREPFTFTKALVADVFGKQGRRHGNRIVVDRSIVGTTLNGYEVRDPYRKKAARAGILHLTSSMEEPVFARVSDILRRNFLGARIHYLSGSSLRFQAIRTAFPHERELLIVDAGEAKTTFYMLRSGLPVAVLEEPERNETGAVRALRALSKRFPLPDTVIVAGRPDALEETKKALGKGSAARLVPLRKGHVSQFIDATRADLGLLLMALFYQARRHDLEDMHTEGA